MEQENIRYKITREFAKWDHIHIPHLMNEIVVVNFFRMHAMANHKCRFISPSGYF